MSKEKLTKDKELEAKCPFSNPGTCPFIERIVALEQDVRWLKKISTAILTVILGVLIKLIVGG